jgi:hypothetical protein
MFSCFFDLKNVFSTVKILTFNCGEFKYVQMDQGLITKICIKNTFFKEKLFTKEVQGILKGGWLVRRLWTIQAIPGSLLRLEVILTLRIIIL